MNISSSFQTYYNKLAQNEQARQSFWLLIWNLVGILVGILNNIIVTRYLGAIDYGNYLYIMRVFTFIVIIINFGLFPAINRAILQGKSNREVSEMYGTSFMIVICLYVVTCIVLLGFALISDNFEEKGIQELFIKTIPLCILAFLPTFFDQVLPSSNNIRLLIIQRYLPKVAFTFITFFIYVFSIRYKLSWNHIITVWISWALAEASFYTYVYLSLNPSFKNIGLCVRKIIGYNKDFGLQVYIGDLFSNAFSALLPILLSYVCIDNTYVGFYALSLTIATPLRMFPSIIGTSYYKSFSTYKEIPQKLLKTTMLMSICGLLCVWALVTPFVKICYTSEFEPVIYLTFISSIGSLLYGLSDLFSRFLMAHGEGVLIRNSSFIVGFVTLMSSLILIPWLKGYGASFAYVCAGITYAIVIISYYNKCKLKYKS